MTSIKTKLENTDLHRILRNVTSADDLIAKVAESFELEKDSFHVTYIDAKGDRIIMDSQHNVRQTETYRYSEKPIVDKYIVCPKLKKPVEFEEKPPTSSHSTTASPASTTPSTSADTGLSSFVDNQPTDLDERAKESAGLAKLEKLLRKAVKNTSKITQIMYEQQQQQESPPECLINTVHHPSSQFTSTSCGGYQKNFIGHNHACKNCHPHNKIPHPAPHSAMATPSSGPGKLTDLKQTHGVRHDNTICDHCDSVIVGIRYKCGNCSNFDLCETCERLPAAHNQDHVFLKIRRPVFAAATNVPLLPTFAYAYKPTDCTVHQKPQANGEHEHAATSTNNSDISTGSSDSELLATFVGHTNIPDGYQVETSRSFLKFWRIENSGDRPWPAGCVLKHLGGMGPTKLRYENDLQLSEISPGEQVNVSVYLNAPTLCGSYGSYFRMMTPQGKMFGDVLQCSIDVIETSSDIGLGSSETRTSSSTAGHSSPLATSSMAPSDISIHQINNNDDGTNGGCQGIHVGVNTSTKTSVSQHDHGTSSPTFQTTEYVLVSSDSVDQPASQRACSLDASNGKSLASDTQADITDWLKISNQQQNKEFPYAQQLAQIHEMGIVNYDEDAKKLLVVYGGNMDHVLLQLWKTISATL